MREEDAIFGGEVTGHYYFRDNFYADNGFIPALLILELMSRKGQTLRELLAPLREKYFISGEINTKLQRHATWSQEKIDALTRSMRTAESTRWTASRWNIPDWHFNVRASNTEPMLRLNLEATTQELMEQKRDEVLAFIQRRKAGLGLAWRSGLEPRAPEPDKIGSHACGLSIVVMSWLPKPVRRVRSP